MIRFIKAVRVVESGLQQLNRLWCRVFSHKWSLVGTLHKHPGKSPREAWCYRCGKEISDRELAEYMIKRYSYSEYQIGNAAYSAGLSKEYVRGVADSLDY